MHNAKNTSIIPVIF